MKILIVVTMTNNFGKKGSYNSQEIGLARGLAELGHEVIVYKSVKSDEEVGTEQLSNTAMIHYIKCRYVGSNGFLSTKNFDKNADVLIQFADLQLSVPHVYSWTVKNGIKYIPYNGITRSQSGNKYIKTIIEILAHRNYKIYKKNGCVAKNDRVSEKLVQLGVNKVKLAPVCVDFEQLHKNYEAIDFTTLREKWNIPRDVRVILYVGRFEKDKRPLDMISLFNKLDEHNYLLMVGTGALLEQTKQQINLLGLQNRVKIIERIPNKDIWELYCLSDVFVNLNYTEIWGMVLLEAMYYRLGIIAVNAPGPQNIILDNRYGMLAKSDDEILTFLKDGRFTNDIIDAAYQRVTTEFRWSKSGEIMLSMLEGDK